MNFKEKLTDWINESLHHAPLDEIKGFSFNLFESADGFWIELIGSGVFDLADSDWACEKIFEPPQRNLLIPVDISGNTWEECLINMKELINVYYDSKEPGAQVLRKVDGVGIGFVDGDLEILTNLQI